jgi:hypothetical protein
MNFRIYAVWLPVHVREVMSALISKSESESVTIRHKCNKTSVIKQK